MVTLCFPKVGVSNVRNLLDNMYISKEELDQIPNVRSPLKLFVVSFFICFKFQPLITLLSVASPECYPASGI